jgi:hypothetical protein
MNHHDPETIYRERYHARDALVRAAGRRSGRLADLRLLVGGGGLLLGALLLAGLGFSGWWLTLPVAVFIGLVVVHRRVEGSRQRARLARDHYEQGLHRLDHTWPGTGLQHPGFPLDEHPYAIDLDLFGRGSLFERLCTATTEAGADRLAEWLLEPAPPKEIARRQAAVTELASRLALREELAVRAGTRTDPAAAIPSTRLRRWAAAGTGSGRKIRRRLRLGAAIASSLVVFGLIVWERLTFGPLLFWTAALLAWGFYVLASRRTQPVLRELEPVRQGLRALAALVARIEEEPVTTPRLRTVQSALVADGRTASRAVARLDRLCTWLDSTRNMLFAPFAYLLLLPIHLALSIERWRETCGPSVPAWLDALGDWEALMALASYHWENPHDPFPEFVSGPPRFEGIRLGHPLLADDVSVPNDVRLATGPTDPPDVVSGGDHGIVSRKERMKATACWLVSGSNMSGKSTLLRTVGSNVVLAQAGAPVRAHRLQLTPLRIGATLRIEDSLLDGRSRFYAEIARLHRITELAGEGPLLFLLDEILHGTNSHDRRIGSWVVVRGLLERGAIGLVTTHDLALADIEHDLPGQVTNVHFEDRLEGGELCFDYRLRPGVVGRGNALDLMRGLGFIVPEEGA